MTAEQINRAFDRFEEFLSTHFAEKDDEDSGRVLRALGKGYGMGQEAEDAFHLRTEKLVATRFFVTPVDKDKDPELGELVENLQAAAMVGAVAALMARDEAT